MNDPFDMDADIKLVLPKMMSSINFMKSIKRFEVNKNSIAIWTLGQNGFIIKDNDGTLIYASKSCVRYNVCIFDHSLFGNFK